MGRWKWSKSDSINQSLWYENLWVDWNRFHPEKIVACSLGKAIMSWDCNNSGMMSMFLFCGLFGLKTQSSEMPKLT
jgi:hypothetical protein